MLLLVVVCQLVAVAVAVVEVREVLRALRRTHTNEGVRMWRDCDDRDKSKNNKKDTYNYKTKKKKQTIKSQKQLLN